MYILSQSTLIEFLLIFQYFLILKTSIIRLSTDLTKFLISSGVMGWKTSWITSHNVFLLPNCRQLVYKRLFVMSQTYSVGFNSMELARHFINLAPLNPILSRNITVLLAECAGAPSYMKTTFFLELKWLCFVPCRRA